MKKKVAGLAAALSLLCLSTGCGNTAVTNGDLNRMDVERYVTLGDYSALSVSVAPAEVDETQWEELTLAVYRSYVSGESGGVTDRAVEVGDTVIIDYEGKLDGVAFEGGTDTDAELTIGSNQFIAGFEDGLVGVMPGETVDLDLAFPESYWNPEMAGKAVVFTVTVNYILPGFDEMEDSFVAALGMENVDTAEQLRQYVYDYLMENAEMNYRYDVQDALMDELMSRSTFQELPESFLESYRQIFSSGIQSIAAENGVTADVYTNYYYGMSSEEYAAVGGEFQAKQELLLQAIANREGLTVSEEELQARLEEDAAYAGYASVEDLLEDYDKEGYRNYMMTEKVLDYLMENAEITE